MRVTITPGPLRGTITPPPSKSQAHRAIIAAALAQGTSRVRGLAPSRDITATLACMTALGAEAAWSGNEVSVTGLGGRRTGGVPRLDCGESGSTLRFLIPIALAVAGGGEFHGRGRLMQRPQDPYFAIFREKGIAYAQDGDALRVEGELTPGTYRLPGNVSSQFVTGLLYALPLLAGDSRIELTTPLESAGYVAMTLETLKTFGVKAAWEGPRTLLVPGGQRFRAAEAEIEPDWSQAAFWVAARTMGNPVTVTGMDPRSVQGDRVFLHWADMTAGRTPAGGVSVPIWGKGTAKGETPQASGPSAVSIDVSQNPDLVPPLAAMGAVMDGTLYIRNAARLRLKESDRLSSVTAVLRAMGADIQEREDGLTIEGRPALTGGVTVDAWNDHRIAMMAAIAATRCERPVTVTGAECVEKSYPSFWQDYRALGGKAEETE